MSGSIRLDIRKMLITERVVGPWNRLARAVATLWSPGLDSM